MSIDWIDWIDSVPLRLPGCVLALISTSKEVRLLF
jgi:hypothetical protein